jgi:hypothetical protein
MAGWAAAASGVGTAAGSATTGDVDPALEMLTDGGGAGEEGEEGEELIFNLRKNRLATAGDGKRLLVVAGIHWINAGENHSDLLIPPPRSARRRRRNKQKIWCGRLMGAALTEYCLSVPPFVLRSGSKNSKSFEKGPL